MSLVFTRTAMRRIDSEAVQDHGMTGLELMENAARGAAQLACSMLADQEQSAVILIACGCGNNGGDGWAISRLLMEDGHQPHVVHLGSPAAGSDASINMERARRAGVPSHEYRPGKDLQLPEEPVLVIDAMFGTGLDREMEGSPLELARCINDLSAPILAIDLPSGLDADTGQPLGEAVRASATATFVGPKLGFTAAGASAWTGKVHVVDIGVPPTLLQQHGTPCDH
ncbi:MAG: NAD(P)H-hydrate epimerase [Planctomycetota bacterium]|nr:NAD(P)H-hydrate epimerase [Planctomycetota bacterium]